MRYAIYLNDFNESEKEKERESEKQANKFLIFLIAKTRQVQKYALNLEKNIANWQQNSR